MDTGSQKTHNFCVSVSVHEIQESDLQAKNKRRVEKRKLTMQRQCLQSLEAEKNKKVKKAPSTESPWKMVFMDAPFLGGGPVHEVRPVPEE
ncbi:Centriole, cilia and spindle-associated protein [Sciurus carolinensis]|uniref:Centriole, cilia and spindle-associated protein n=1 Tax=Sciurus carolinensis TaxID=30640 RepID=A0AA41MBM5_SCICA|nr:Centriole, cilia and spindle-associated protein [Sciurus carolinensis]